ncbi:unnamed protein product [Callosobruchus maculatus]|uniref:Uncharacterized protein n=1 Tax=Callosobruchus maculatus TaxID=64391 RepID=A0A653DXD8_CALMS|nr:unnamed protein product [Callosobruchus maculatus]
MLWVLPQLHGADRGTVAAAREAPPDPAVALGVPEAVRHRRGVAAGRAAPQKSGPGPGLGVGAGHMLRRMAMQATTRQCA